MGAIICWHLFAQKWFRRRISDNGAIHFNRPICNWSFR